MTRLATIRKDRCNPQGCGGHLCIKVCPINRTGKECIVKGSDNKPLIDEGLCTGCGICPNRCPFDAISIINLPEELKTSPIHRYGPNDFALYSLPMPLFGKVVGIIGKNGIGKSTAIQILAGALEPNLGKDSAELSEVFEFFKGTEMQIFFEKFKDGDVKVAYKPQNIDQIAKAASGKVIDMLKKVDETGKIDYICKELSIDKILENEISTLSGGEMQRLAIAATVLKKANVFIFDEPTSYLDIKQRLRIAKFIKELATEDVAVLVIEHDLIALDYMADLVHIMYGKENAFGVVSLPKAARTGINIYLDGYMREENIRFRDSKIVFDVKPPMEEGHIKELTTWPRLEKKVGNFQLVAEEGTVNRHETVGVLGENGIGKTTFVKLLAGVVKPDTGEVAEIDVAYKPQYLQTDSDDLVIVFLERSIRKYTNEIINPLNLKPLFSRKLSELSGGQLQRVYIAKALGEKASLVLLDEPSAHLDVEQRLFISKIIRNVAEHRGYSVLVVDHDLVFLDYLSNRLLVFEGEPAKHGECKGPFSMEQGMNSLLKDVEITLRRDPDSKRPRINKLDSQKDSEQKKSGNYYYA